MIYNETVTEKMKSIAKNILKNLDSRYYLAGGTALALQIGHRKSIDLDYFINDKINTLKLRNDLLEIFKDKKVEFTFEEKNSLWCSIDGVKVSFISRFNELMDEVLMVDDFRLAQINDLTAMKLSAICGREEYKDYFDLACLATITDVRLWNNWWQKVYKNNDPISFIIALANTDKIPEIQLDIEDKFKTILPKKILAKAVLEIKSFIV